MNKVYEKYMQLQKIQKVLKIKYFSWYGYFWYSSVEIWKYLSWRVMYFINNN